MSLQNFIIKKIAPRKVKNIRRIKRDIQMNFSHFLSIFTDNSLIKARSVLGKFTEISLDSDKPEYRWLKAFMYYRFCYRGKPIHLVWAESPIPGNYGDWLSPYILSKISMRPIIHFDEVNEQRDIKPHIVSLGSIGGAITENSIVLGTGVASPNVILNKNAKYISVRGPYTLEVLGGGGASIGFGDIGFILNRIYPCLHKKQVKGTLFIRHINHRGILINLPSDVTEISILSSHPEDIEGIINEIVSAKFVVTSAMHVFITANAYKIPAILIDFHEEKVPGNGMKYKDSFSGVGLPEVMPIRYDVNKSFNEQIKFLNAYCHYCSSEVKDSIMANIKQAIGCFDDR